MKRIWAIKMVTQISNNDVEAELSYAYLHAVAAMAGAECTISSRLSDNRGIDAQLTAWGPFPNGGQRVEVDLKIQLKATVSEPTDLGSHLSYTLKDITRYDDLRKKDAYATPRILVVLYLPKYRADWIAASANDLSLRNCAYWVSLAGAEQTTNRTSITVYFPKAQMLTPESLTALFASLSHGGVPDYVVPEGAVCE